jgi:hypothetical protein
VFGAAVADGAIYKNGLTGRNAGFKSRAGGHVQRQPARPAIRFMELNDMKLIYIFTVVVIALAVLFYFGEKPWKIKNVSLDELEKYLEALLKRGFNGGFLIMEVPQTSLFVQFSKYIKKKGPTGLQFDFPLAPWSEKYYNRLKSQLSKEKINYSTEEVSGGKVEEFLTVDLEQNIAKAAEVARLTLRSVFELGSGQAVTVYFQHINPKDEEVVA